MAIMYDYKCKKCGQEQTKWHKLNETNEEPCEKCEAPAEDLVKQLSATRPHGTWSRW